MTVPSHSQKGIRTLVLVEGDSDAGAVRALADLIGCDLASHHIEILSTGGVTNFAQVLADFIRSHPTSEFCGMYDVADARHVPRAPAAAGTPIAPHESIESVRFSACVADLEDELIRALGVEAIERLLDAHAELTSFRRFQAMPQHPHAHAPRQLQRILGE